DSIDVVAKMFLKNMTPEGQLLVRYDFIFDFVHVSVSNLVDERTCVKEAITLRYIYTNHFDTYVEDTTRYRRTLDKLVDHRHIQVTYLLSGWEVIDLSRDNFSSRAVTQYYNWDGV
ncbi:14050_t:CDS:2, partial [Gigaspora margarita]